MVVLPEVKYPHGGNIRFDLTNMTQALAAPGSALRSIAIGVFRGEETAGSISDPAPSSYKYYEKEFSYPFTLSINNYGIVGADHSIRRCRYIIPVDEYDFELRRVEMSVCRVPIRRANSRFFCTTRIGGRCRISRCCRICFVTLTLRYRREGSRFPGKSWRSGRLRHFSTGWIR